MAMTMTVWVGREENRQIERPREITGWAEVEQEILPDEQSLNIKILIIISFFHPQIKEICQRHSTPYHAIFSGSPLQILAPATSVSFAWQRSAYISYHWQGNHLPKWTYLLEFFQFTPLHPATNATADWGPFSIEADSMHHTIATPIASSPGQTVGYALHVEEYFVQIVSAAHTQTHAQIHTYAWTPTLIHHTGHGHGHGLGPSLFELISSGIPSI